MLQDRIAFRYAKSLFDLAQEKQLVERIKEDFDALEKLYADSTEFRAFLRSPIITAEVKRKAIGKLFGSSFDALTLVFADKLVMRHREGLLPEVLREYKSLYHASRKETVVKLTSAEPLDGAQKDAIASKLNAKLGTKILFEEAVDPALIGGFKVLVGTELYDATVLEGLRKLTKKFSST